MDGLVRLNTKDIQDLVDSEDVGKIEAKVNELLLSGDFASAERLLDTYIRDVSKTESKIYSLRAECYLKAGKYIQALHDMEQAMLFDPTMPCCKSSLEHYQIKKGLMRMSNDI